MYWLSICNVQCGRSLWPRGLRRGSAAARLLRSWVRMPPGAWMFVCCECCVLLCIGLCDELITRPEECYGCLSVVLCVVRLRSMRRADHSSRGVLRMSVCSDVYCQVEVCSIVYCQVEVCSVVCCQVEVCSVVCCQVEVCAKGILKYRNKSS